MMTNDTSMVEARLVTGRRVRDSPISRSGGEEKEEEEEELFNHQLLHHYQEYGAPRRQQGFPDEEVLRRNVSVTFLVSVRDREDSDRVHTFFLYVPFFCMYLSLLHSLVPDMACRCMLLHAPLSNRW